MSEPFLDRPVNLRFMGDWGGANLTRVCGWLAQELYDRAPGESFSTIRTGRGCIDNLRAVAAGEVDVALVTPSAIASLAIEGRGPFEGEAISDLRALGELPHPDRLLFAVRSDLGASSIAEIRERRLPLRLSSSPDDGVNFVGFAVRRVLEACDLSPESILEQGGEVIEHERPFECLEDVASGRADSIFHEAIMAPPWHRLAEEVPLTYISLDPDAVGDVAEELACPPVQIPSGYMAGMDADVHTLDFSGYLVLVREDMPTDVAALLAWILDRRSAAFAAHFRHVPPERSPIRYPIEREDLTRAEVPLHPGAVQIYEQTEA